VVKEIKFKKMEMTKFITFQMLQMKKMQTNDDIMSIVVGYFVYKCVEAKNHRW